MRLDVFCGIDWSKDRHDIALVDCDGGLPARLRISDDPAGVARLLELLAEHGVAWKAQSWWRSRRRADCWSPGLTGQPRSGHGAATGKHHTARRRQHAPTPPAPTWTASDEP
jgi:hypothetical protein